MVDGSLNKSLGKAPLELLFKDTFADVAEVESSLLGNDFLKSILSSEVWDWCAKDLTGVQRMLQKPSCSLCSSSIMLVRKKGWISMVLYRLCCKLNSEIIVKDSYYLPRIDYIGSLPWIS